MALILLVPHSQPTTLNPKSQALNPQPEALKTVSKYSDWSTADGEDKARGKWEQTSRLEFVPYEKCTIYSLKDTKHLCSYFFDVLHTNHLFKGRGECPQVRLDASCFMR
jgi:hypothetical protein